MEKLKTLTADDVDHGVLQQMLNEAGIDDVPQYADEFHKQTENLIVEDLQKSNSTVFNEEIQIVTPLDMQRWWKSMTPRLEQNVMGSASTETTDNHSAPVNLSTWIKSMVPTTDETSVSSGNVGQWLQNWSNQFSQQPPASLDNWVKDIAEKNLDQPVGKAESSTGRLNSYLTAAQEVFNEYGYGSSTPKLVAASTAAQEVFNEYGYGSSTPKLVAASTAEAKPDRLADVKQMYFLWRCIDMNQDRKITVEDFQIILEKIGLGFLSKYVARALFFLLDVNHNGVLEFQDLVVLVSIIVKLIRLL